MGLAPVITNASVVDDNVLDGELDANGLKDRMYWVQLLDKMASPILSNMSKGELRKNMPMDIVLPGTTAIKKWLIWKPLAV